MVAENVPVKTDTEKTKLETNGIFQTIMPSKLLPKEKIVLA